MINRQRHRASCGPVAIKNALEFKGVKTSYDEILEFSEKYLNYECYGMWIKELRYGLQLFGINYKNIHNPKFEHISKELEKGRGFILLYMWYYEGSTRGHYVFIDKETPKYFRAWNWSLEKSEMIPKQQLANYLRYSNRHHSKSYSKGIVIL